MYTGTLIRDLMTTVERAEQSPRRQRVSEEMELQRIYELQDPWMRSEQVFVGAA